MLFEDFEQKIISGYIVFLWERDPCKAKWAIAAKAYSVIRDQVGKEHAPLDVFLMLVAKPLGIVEPQAYLAVMGWEISVNEVGNVSLVKNDAMKIESSILSTNVSVEDMIGYACQHGYAGAIGSIVAAPTDKPMMAMAASEQPHSGKILENEDKNDHNGTQDIATIANASVQADDKHEEATAVTHQHDNLTAVSPSTQNTAATTVAQPSAANLMPMMAATNDFDSTSPFDIGNILDFDPEANLPFYAPSVGDEWDAFDISAWIHEDAYIN